MARPRILLTAAATFAAAIVLPAQARPPAGLTSYSWTIDGVKRSALVAAPKTPAAAPGSPLVVVFHGHGGNSAQAARTFRIHEVWPEAVVIYPQGLPTAGQITDPQGNLPGWQHTPGGEHDRDLNLFDAMLAWAKTTFTIDGARVFAAGHSNGGSMVYVLWAARGDRFAALAPSSSVFRADLIKTASPKPAFIVSGQKDPLVPFATQQLSLQGVLRLNQITTRAPAPWSGGAKKYASSSGADVIAYIHPGGHPMPADAGELMVKFFKEIK